MLDKDGKLIGGVWKSFDVESDQWNRAQFEFVNPGHARLAVNGTAMTYIAVDNITITEGACPPLGIHKNNKLLSTSVL